MRTANTFGLQFLIRPDKLKNGKAPIPEIMIGLFMKMPHLKTIDEKGKTCSII
jgi:hypothetical protein